MTIRARDVARAVKAGGGLEQLAYELARVVDDPESSGSEKAACGRELRMVLAAIDAKGGVKEGDDLDELAARREARLSR